MSSHSASDSGMQKMMIIVAIALSLLTVTIVITARTLSSGSNDEFDALLHNAKMDRIQPVAKVRTEAPVVEEVAAAMELSGEELASQGVCAGCHSAGVGGAPMFTDTAAWDTRAELGLEALVASVVNGKGGMPARGGSDYSDEQITRAVAYMTGLGDGGGVAAAVDPAAEAPAAEEAVATAAPETDAAAVSEPAADESADSAVAETEASTAESTTSVAAVESAPAEGVTAALTPRIQTTVDQGVCAGCHLSGIAGAPKYGDTQAWAARAEKGYAALAQTVASGKGAMPPRGGSDLTDDELLIAVEYMVQKNK